MDIREVAEEAAAHLRRADPVLAAVIERVGPFDLAPPRSPFVALARAIIYQQLSGRAATAILQRLQDLYGGEFPTPPQLLATPEGELRRAGISERKVEYMKGLAAAFLDGSVDGEGLAALPDEEVVERLTRLRGIGRWSAEMFLIFSLGRPNVLPLGDLGFRKAVRDAYGLPALPTPEEVRELARRWEPYCSVATWYLWRSRWTVPAAPSARR